LPLRSFEFFKIRAKLISPGRQEGDLKFDNALPVKLYLTGIGLSATEVDLPVYPKETPVALFN
jgi:hypothetical protein